jgi:DHA1 family multidrug resistance protein-like MFS transporter
MDAGDKSAASINEEEKPHWGRSLTFLFIAQFLSIAGFAFALPFIPYFIREIGVTDEHMVPVWAGILAASTSFVMTIFSPIWGWLADRHGRKIMVERAMFGGAVITFFMGLVANVYQLLFLRLIAGAMTGTIAASISLATTSVPREKVGFSLGMMQVAVFSGMTLGPWIGGVLADAAGYRHTFMIGSVLLFIGGAFVLMGVKEKFVKPSKEMIRRQKGLSVLFSLPGFTTMLLAFFFFNFSAYVAAPIFPLYVETMADVIKEKIASTTGLLFAISGGTAAIAAGGIGYMSDKVGYKKIFMITIISAGIAYAFQAAVHNVHQLMIVRFFYGFAAGGILPTMNALVGRIVPHEHYGKAYGVTSSMTCLGMAMGPLLGGVMAAHMGYRWPFVLVSIMLITLVFPVATYVRQK